MLKRIIFFVTSLLLILSSTLMNATTLGMWRLSNPFAVGASILYDGLKGAITSSVLITPSASQVAKVLTGGGAGYALSFAVEQLLGAVDWVLDPANNSVKYKKEIKGTGVYGIIFDGYRNLRFNTKTEACNASIARLRVAVNNSSLNYTSINGLRCIVPGYDLPINQYEAPKIEEKTLSLETVAQKVIENAESDNLDAQFAVLAAATNILSEAEKDDAKAKPIEEELERNAMCPSGIVRNGSCWICDKPQFMPITRATRDAKTATRGKSCKNVTDTAIKNANATLFRNLINTRIQENACWSPPDPNHATALVDAQNALSLCEN